MHKLSKYEQHLHILLKKSDFDANSDHSESFEKVQALLNLVNPNQSRVLSNSHIRLRTGAHLLSRFKGGGGWGFLRALSSTLFYASFIYNVHILTCNLR
jgi:hypothetical protein